jgi:hypothetical protein
MKPHLKQLAGPLKTFQPKPLTETFSAARKFTSVGYSGKMIDDAVFLRIRTDA